jgi:hypothetical protein
MNRPATATEVEAQVLAWLRRELSDEEISATDNFLDVGGHSALAIELNTWLREKYGAAADLADLFRGPIGPAVAAVVVRP